MKTKTIIPLFFILNIIMTVIPSFLGTDSNFSLFWTSIFIEPTSFVVVCSVALVIFMVFTFINYRQALPGQQVVRKQGMRLKASFNGILIWFAIALLELVLAANWLRFYEWIGVYWLTILAAFSIYILFQKWLVIQFKPEFLALHNEDIYLRRSLRKGKRKLVNLKAITYEPMEHIIHLRFEEGLQNAMLHTSDYNREELRNFINTIKRITDNNIKIDERLEKDFLVESFGRQ